MDQSNSKIRNISNDLINPELHVSRPERSPHVSEAVISEYHIIHGPENPAFSGNQQIPMDTTQDQTSGLQKQTKMTVLDKPSPSSTRAESKLSEQANSTSASSSRNVGDHTMAQLQGPALPHVDCPEKIVICLDLSREMNTTTFRSRAGDKYSGLELARRAIKMFVLHKSQMNPKHQFAFLVFKEEATMIQSFTSRAQDILNTLDESEIEPQESAPLNFTSFFETIKENVELPTVQGDPQVMPPPFIVRVLMLYGRSHCVPVSPSGKAQQELESSPYFFTDVLYIHEPPSEDNKCEEIFKVFCDLDHNGMSYIFEQSKYTPILNSGAKLLAHPLQRPRQLDALYKIGSPIPPAQPPPQPPPAGAVMEERVY